MQEERDSSLAESRASLVRVQLETGTVRAVYSRIEQLMNLKPEAFTSLLFRAFHSGLIYSYTVYEYMPE